MNIAVLLKMVPDVVEELSIAENGKTLDEAWLRLNISESDGYALEEAIILKEKYGGTVTVAALDAEEVDYNLFLALAKGADRAIRITGDWKNYGSPAIAKVFTKFLQDDGIIDKQTLILSGSQAIDDLEGEMVHYLADNLNLPGNSIVTGINYNAEHNKITYFKEFSGGIRGEFEVEIPAVLGVQAAENPPRYIPIAKVKAIQKTAHIEEVEIPPSDMPVMVEINRLFLPEITGAAEILSGTEAEISSRIVDILSEKGII